MKKYILVISIILLLTISTLSINSKRRANVATATRSKLSKSAEEVCKPGTFKTADGECEPCRVGSYSSISGATRCLKCHHGYIASSEGSTSCTKCAAGSYSYNSLASNPSPKSKSSKSTLPHRVGHNACGTCEAGYFNNGGTTTCSLIIPLPKDINGNTLPAVLSRRDIKQGLTTPPPNSATYNQGACHEGSFFNGNTKQCELCRKGTYTKNTYSFSCTGCSFGTYADKDGSTSCKKCEAGKYSVNENGLNFAFSSCSPCPSGTSSKAGGKCEPTEGDSKSSASLLQESMKLDSFSTVAPSCEAGQYYDSCHQGCKICPAGTFSAAGDTTCTLCPIGSYQNLASQSCCRVCDSVLSEGATSGPGCESNTCYAYTESASTCPAGKYYSSTIGACLDCAAGSYSEGGTTSCTLCPINHYQELPGQGCCTYCGEDTIDSEGEVSGARGCDAEPVCVVPISSVVTTSAPGSGTGTGSGGSSSKSCDAGYEGINGVCTACKKGYFKADAGFEYCKACDIGQFQVVEAQTFCYDCVAGRYSSATSESDCKNCVPGYYSPANKATECLECEPGAFQAEEVQSQCQQCISGSYSNWAYSICIDCEAGTYSDSKATKCITCAAGTWSPPGQDACIDCAEGYISAAGASECIECPSGVSNDDKTVCL